MVQGIGDLNKKIAQLPRRIETAARRAMETGADELVEMMKRLVPKDSGDLRDSIGWTWGNAPAGAKVIAQSDPNERGLRITVYAGSKKAYYAAWVEFGTAPHNVATGGGNKSFKGVANAHPGGRAQPFFFPSYRSLRKRIQARIKRQTRAAMKFQGPSTAPAGE
jgi:HK97 gp10 family phage protein